MQPANGLETFIEVSWGLHHNCVGTAVVEIEAKCTAGEGYDEDLPTQVNGVVKHGCYREKPDVGHLQQGHGLVSM